MPPRARLTTEEAVALVEDFIEHFKTHDLPRFSAPIWKEMSSKTDGKWTYRDVYVNVRENRRGILSQARTNRGIVLKRQYHELDPALDDIISLDDDDLADIDFSNTANSLDTFEVTVANDQWKQLHEFHKIGDDMQLIVKQNEWAKVLSAALREQTTIRCDYAFKWVHIDLSPKSTYYMTVKGYCVTKGCRNPFLGYVSKDPVDDDLVMLVKTRDTSHKKHNITSPVKKRKYNKKENTIEKLQKLWESLQQSQRDALIDGSQTLVKDDSIVSGDAAILNPDLVKVLSATKRNVKESCNDGNEQINSEIDETMVDYNKVDRESDNLEMFEPSNFRSTVTYSTPKYRGTRSTTEAFDANREKRYKIELLKKRMMQDEELHNLKMEHEDMIHNLTVAHLKRKYNLEIRTALATTELSELLLKNEKNDV